MDVGKAILCRHKPSSIVWSENGPCCGNRCIFHWRKKEARIWFNIICLKFYLFERITWWCLSVLEHAPQYVLKFVMLEKRLKKIVVSWNLCQAHLQEVGLMKISGDHKTLSIVCHVGLHIDFSSTKSSLGL